MEKIERKAQIYRVGVHAGYTLNMANKRRTTAKTRNRQEIFATWNVTGLGNKEPALVEFMKKSNVQILGLAYTRKKGQNTKRTHESYVFIWSGVDQRATAKQGVGFLLHPEKLKAIINTKFISEKNNITADTVLLVESEQELQELVEQINRHSAE